MTRDEAWTEALKHEALVKKLVGRIVSRIFDDRVQPVNFSREEITEHLQGAGWEAMLKAVEKFDPGHDSAASFETFAHSVLMTDLYRAYSQLTRGKGGIRLARRTAEGKRTDRLYVHPVASVEGLVESLEQRSGSQETPDPDVALAQAGYQGVDEGFEDELVNTLVEDDLQERLSTVIDGMSEPHRTVVLLRLQGKSQREIGDHFGYTQQWTWKREQEAIEYLRWRMAS